MSPPDDQNSGAPPIECVQDTVRASFMLNPQFAHVGELWIANCIGIRPGQRRTHVLKHVHGGIYAILFLDRQAVPPFAKFIREFDFPSHAFIM